MKRLLAAVAMLVMLAPMTRAQTNPTGGRPGAQPVGTANGTGVHFVYMVRHGIYDRDSTATDDRVANGLNAKGHQQAKRIGERLAALPVKFDRLISSELLRAAQTADDMSAAMHLSPKRDGVLNECTPTTNSARIMAGDTPADIAQCDSARVVQWARYFAPTPDRDTYDVLVCHGNIIRWTLMKALGADTRDWYKHDVGNCSLSIFAVRPDGTIRLVMYSDVGTIPVDVQTWSGRGGGWVAPR